MALTMQEELEHIFTLTYNCTRSPTYSANDSLCVCIDPNQEKFPQWFYEDLSQSEKIAFGCAFVLVTVLGLLGNIFVLIIFVQRGTPKVVELLTMVVAGSQLVHSAIVPLYGYHLLSPHWALSTDGCRLYELVQGTTVSLSIIAITAIAIERYMCVAQRRTEPLSLGHYGRRLLVLGFVTLALALVCPLMPAVRTFEWLMKDPSLVTCVTTIWRCHRVPGYISLENYEITVFVLLFIVPFIIISFCYTCIIWKLRALSPSAPPPQEARTAVYTHSQQQRKQVVMTLLWMVLLFYMWTPYFVVVLYDTLKADVVNKNALVAALHLVGLLNCVFNPVLYVFSNSSNRKQIKLLFTKAAKCVAKLFHLKRSKTLNEPELRD